MNKKETTNVAEVNYNEVTSLRLLITGMLNEEKVNQITSEQLKSFVENDTAARLTQWLSTHFTKDDPLMLSGVEAVADYTILDYHYNKKGKYICKLTACVSNNVVLKVSASDIQKHNDELY